MSESSQQPKIGQIPSAVIDDSFDESVGDFQLFRAYREGQLDCEVINTQPSRPRSAVQSQNVPSSEDKQQQPISIASSFLPRSWNIPTCSTETSEPVEKKLISFGQLCPTQLTSANTTSLGAQPSDVMREPFDNSSSSKLDGPSHKLGRGNAILVNQRQRGNPLLKFIHNVAWEYADIEPDYVVGRNHCVYFLSLRYHNLNSEYIFERVRQTKHNYQLAVLLCQVDITDPHYPLKELCKFCLAEKLTLMLAWSPGEAARYLEAYKALENKPPDGLMPDTTSVTDPMTQVTEFLTSIRMVTKADAASAVNKFGTVANIIEADDSSLEDCPGFGRRKAQKLHEVFHLPFVRDMT